MRHSNRAVWLLFALLMSVQATSARQQASGFYLKQDMKSPDMQKEIKALDDVEADLVKQQRLAAQPRTHRYELVPQT